MNASSSACKQPFDYLREMKYQQIQRLREERSTMKLQCTVIKKLTKHLTFNNCICSILLKKIEF